MRVLHVGVPEDEYWRQINEGRLGEIWAGAIRQTLADAELGRVMVYGTNTKTGALLRELLGERFVAYVNRDTLDPALRPVFDSIILGTSPRHYGKILQDLERTFGSDGYTVVTCFDDLSDAGLIADKTGKKPTPCHFRELFIKYDGDAFPCCLRWQDKRNVVFNVRDEDIMARMRAYDIGACSCGTYWFVPGDRAPFQVDLMTLELSLVCNSKCAMCCAHSPEYTEQFAAAPRQVSLDDLERCLDLFRPRRVFFQGGEVLIDDEAFRWIAKIRKRFPESHFMLVTNGNTRRYSAEDIFGVFDHCYVDFYGFQPHTYKTITGLQLQTTRDFAESLCRSDAKRVTLKYLTTPVNFHESSLFLSWALGQNPHLVHVCDAESQEYINRNNRLASPRFSPCGSNDMLPNMYWGRVFQRTVRDLGKIMREQRAHIEANSIRVVFNCGVFSEFPVNAGD